MVSSGSQNDNDSILHGNHCENDQPVQVFAGSLSMIYENGAIRYVKAGGHELIRMIYPAVRDREWLTITPIINNETIDIKPDSFIIRYRAQYTAGAIDFSADLTYEGRSDNSLHCIFEGEALATFQKNRIGFCVLHPIEGCSGNNCTIEHCDGIREQSFFPEDISPDQVFREIKSMKWMAGRLKCSIDFEGDVFETEDQRNWTDASYKTYSTPLSVPYPVTVEKGTTTRQMVIFRAEGFTGSSEKHDDRIVIRLSPEETLRLPSIGICRSSRPSALTKNEIRILRTLRFDHYRADLHLFENGWEKKAEHACRESFELGCKLHLALFFDDEHEKEMTDFLKWFSARKPDASVLLLFDRSQPSTPDRLALSIIPEIKKADPDVSIATGTNANFAQMNRNRPGNTGNDHICYSIHPREHASDDRTLAENLKAQEYTVRSARAFAGKKGIIVSPVTIARRFNASNSYIEPASAGSDMPPQADNRIMSLFGACWTAGSIKYLGESGADSITYYEAAGERGIIQGDFESRWPESFPATRGMIFPVYHVFRFILGNKNMSIVKSISSNPLDAECLAVSDGRQARVILVNFSSSARSVEIGCCTGMFRMRTLFADNLKEAVSDHQWTGIANEKIINSQSAFDLEPHSINFISGWIRH